MGGAFNAELLEERLRGRIDSYRPPNTKRFETSMSKRKGAMSGLFDDDSEEEGAALTLGDLAAVHDEVAQVQGSRVSDANTGKNGCGFNVVSLQPTLSLRASSSSTKQEQAKDVSAQDMVESNGTGFNVSGARRSRPDAQTKSTGTIYKITSPSGKAYVGQTVQELGKRMSGHREKARCFALASAIKKYGWESMRVESLLSNVPIAELDAMEDAMIDEHGTMAPHGYNLKSVGSQPYKAGNHESCREAVRAFNSNNPGAQKKKQNTKEINSKRRASWEAKRIVQVATAVKNGNRKEARRLVVAARGSSKMAAKKAAKRCGGFDRDPLQEFEDLWGGWTVKGYIDYAVEQQRTI